MEIFALASKKKLRFTTPQGQMQADDLWTLPFTVAPNRVSTHACLENIGQDLFKAINESTTVSFTGSKSVSAGVNDNKLRLELLEYVIRVRQTESQLELKSKQKTESASMIDQLIAQKKNESLAGLTIEQLEALKNSL